ncbi:MAG: hypothetical protein AB1643_01090 [Patescibacteria group bacterium]
MPIKKIKNYKNGIGLIEVVIGSTIILLAFLGLMSVANMSLRILEVNNHNLQASFLLEEGVEAIKSFRDSGWNQNIATLSSGNNYYLDFNGASWQSTTTNIFIDNFFERKFTIEDVRRDADNDISTSGNIDPGTKKINVYISWVERGATTTKSISTYLTNIFE